MVPRGIGPLPRVTSHDVPVPGLDPAHDGVRVAHLTDIHVGLLASKRRIREAIERANLASPDFTVLTGDYLCFNPRYVPALRDLIGGLNGPVYCVLGNHDYWTDGEGAARALQHHGYNVLRNERTTLSVRGRPMDIIGIDDAITGHADVAASYRNVSTRDDAPSRIVLTHAPGLVRHVASRGGGLVLAGHTHGGQLHVPFLSQRIFNALRKPYIKGLYRVGDATLFVSNGVGHSTLPVRAGAPSEVAVLTLRTALRAHAA